MNTKLYGKIVFSLLCAILLAQHCVGMPPQGFKYRKPLIAQLYEEYEAMSRDVISEGITALMKFKDEVNCCMNSSSVEVQKFFGRLALTIRNIEHQPIRENNVFKHALIQEEVHNLLERYHNKTPGLLHKDFGATIEKIQEYRQAYLENFTSSISRFISQLSASRRIREEKFVDWFQKFSVMADKDSKMVKVIEFFERDQVDAQRFFSRQELNEYVITQYEVLFRNTFNRVKFPDRRGNCLNTRRASGYSDEAKKILSSILAITDQLGHDEIEFPRLYVARTAYKDIYGLLDQLKSTGICHSLGNAAHDELDSFIKKLVAAFDNVFEHESSDPLQGHFSVYFVWFERLDSESGLEQLATAEEYLAGITHLKNSTTKFVHR